MPSQPEERRSAARSYLRILRTMHPSTAVLKAVEQVEADLDAEEVRTREHLVSHPGQCCDGYCVEDLNIHGAETKADALDAAESASGLVKRAVAEALAPIVVVLDEYAATCDPAPFTSERALYDRLRAATARDTPEV